MKDMIFTSEGKNITEDIVKRYLTEDGTKLEVDDNFEKPIEVKGLLYVHPQTPFVLNLNPPKKDLSVSIVYFVFCGKHDPHFLSKYNRHGKEQESAWKEVVTAQLLDLKKCGLYEYVKHINVVCNYTDIKQLTQMKKIIKKLNLNASLFSYEGNEFEYRGIHKVWELAQKQQHDLYFYFHSKGITHNNPSWNKNKYKGVGKVIWNWRKILTYFQHVESIKKVGLLYSRQGIQWLNFWWTRGDYLRGCREPRIEANRMVYEAWLGVELIDRSSYPDNFYDCGGIIDVDISTATAEASSLSDSMLYIGNYWSPRRGTRLRPKAGKPTYAENRLEKLRNASHNLLND